MKCFPHPIAGAYILQDRTAYKHKKWMCVPFAVVFDFQKGSFVLDFLSNVVIFKIPRRVVQIREWIHYKLYNIFLNFSAQA